MLRMGQGLFLFDLSPLILFLHLSDVQGVKCQSSVTLGVVYSLLTIGHRVMASRVKEYIDKVWLKPHF